MVERRRDCGISVTLVHASPSCACDEFVLHHYVLGFIITYSSDDE